MHKQDIIVVGASAGGVEALQHFSASLPRDLPAAVFIVLHIGNGINGNSYLPAILSRTGPLPAALAEDREEIQHGRIYVARPDLHLIVREGIVHVVRGPKENLTRPAINPLFRSAAEAYGARVAGVILTGLLDDGVAGLAEVKRRGGVAVVQNPESALYPSMPASAVEHVDVDYVLEIQQMGEVLNHLACTPRISIEAVEPMNRNLTKLTCPECRGPMWEERQGKIVEYRCRVDHVFSPLTLSEEHRATVERTIWSALVAIEEAAEIGEQLAPELGPAALEQTRLKRAQAAILKKMLKDLGS